MSVEKSLVDAVVSELVATVPALAMAQVHRYSPYSIERLVADGGKHFGVWVAPQEQGGGVVVEPFTTFSSMARYPLLLVYWEPSDEGDFVAADDARTLELMDMAEDARARFLDESFRATSPAWKMDWLTAEVGAGGAQEGGVVRFWVAEVACWVVLSHSA